MVVGGCIVEQNERTEQDKTLHTVHFHSLQTCLVDYQCDDLAQTAETQSISNGVTAVLH